MIMGKILRGDGVTVSILGVTKQDMAMLVKNEAVGCHAEGVGTLLILYAADDATLEAAVQMAGEIVGIEVASTAKPEAQC